MYLRKNQQWIPSVREIEDAYFTSGGEDSHEESLNAVLARAKAEFELQQKAKKAKAQQAAEAAASSSNEAHQAS